MHGEQVRIRADDIELDGALRLPPRPIGVVLMVGGDGSSRLKPPGDYLASVLRNARLGTLWLDLFGTGAPSAERTCLDARTLSGRLSAACAWLAQHDGTHDLPVGLFAASNAAASALHLLAQPGHGISALVLRSARTDPTGSLAMGRINVPTLMIVGGLDEAAITLNRITYAALRVEKRFEVIPGATHFFDESGSLEVAARMTRNWFLQHALMAPAYPV